MYSGGRRSPTRDTDGEEREPGERPDSGVRRRKGVLREWEASDATRYRIHTPDSIERVVVPDVHVPGASAPSVSSVPTASGASGGANASESDVEVEVEVEHGPDSEQPRPPRAEVVRSATMPLCRLRPADTDKRPPLERSQTITGLGAARPESNDGC